MKIITELPTEVTSLLEANEKLLMQWLSARIYAQTVEQAHDDLLVRLNERIDFSEIVAQCQGYRHYAGERGQEGDYSIEQLCRSLMVRYVRDLSLRKTSAALREANLLRWFTGFLLNEKTPSYVTLQRFEQWVVVNQNRVFFNVVLKRIDQDFPEEAQAPQVGDTYAMLSKAAAQTRTQMLRQASEKVLFYLKQVLPALYAGLLSSFPLVKLLGDKQEASEHWLKKEERDALEVRTAQNAAALLQQVQAPVSALSQRNTLEGQGLNKWLTVLQKVLTDEFVIERDAAGQVSNARHCTAEERGHFVLGSSVDVAATFRKHGEKNDLGYNVQVAATRNFIRETFAATGATSDSTGIPALLVHQKEQLGLLPAKLIYDRAAGSAKTYQAVDKASAGQTQLVATLIDHNKNNTRFSPLDFTLHPDGSLTCPNGQTSSKFYRAKGADGCNYRFSAQQCQGCPLRQRCRGEETSATPPTESLAPAAETLAPAQANPPTPLTAIGPDPASEQGQVTEQNKAHKAKQQRKKRTVKPTAHRQVFISDYRDWQRAAILYTKTAEFKLDMTLRPGVERIIAGLVRYNGARDANGYGLANADFQARMAAMAFNLKRWDVLLKAQEKQQQHRQPDSA